MHVLMTLSHAWAASIALVAIFFVALPALIGSLVLFAAVQSAGERTSATPGSACSTRPRCWRGRRS